MKKLWCDLKTNQEKLEKIDVVAMADHEIKF